MRLEEVLALTASAPSDDASFMNITCCSEPQWLLIVLVLCALVSIVALWRSRFCLPRCSPSFSTSSATPACAFCEGSVRLVRLVRTRGAWREGGGLRRQAAVAVVSVTGGSPPTAMLPARP